MNSIYKRAKTAFIDSNEARDFVKLDTNIFYLEKLKDLMEKPFKFVVVYGEPGVGKTMLLKRVIYEKADPRLIPYFKPFFSKEEMERAFCKDLFGNEEIDLLSSLNTLEDFSKTIILDEAQLYDVEILEYIRVIADTKKVRFILVMHQNQDEELMAKEHFKTRIYDNIAIKPPTKKELLIYIHKRLFSYELVELANTFTKTQSNYIYRFTHGNLRLSNKFLFTLFDLLEYFEANHPSLTNTTKIDKKFFEMSAIHLGYIDA